MDERSCNTCACNRVCNHDLYGFENCGNYIHGWVPVKDRPPAKGERVLVSTGSSTYEAYMDVDGDWCRNGIKMEAWFGKVTHWMPVPVLPEEAQENGV